MKILTKLAGAWKQAKEYWYKAQGVWSAVRRVYVKVEGQWKRIYIRNAYFVYSLGLLQNQVPNSYAGLIRNVRGLAMSGRSYNLIQLDSVGDVTFHATYDIFMDGQTGNTGEIERMAADLNAMPEKQIFIICSFDEPMSGHTHPLLVSAVERVGGVPGVFSQEMGYRGAYMLLGKVGLSNYYEKYVGAPNAGGAADGDPNACIGVIFTIIENMVLLQPGNWSWGKSTKRIVHEIYALGHFQTVYFWELSGIWVSDTVEQPAQSFRAGRSYNLVKFSANNVMTFHGVYDLYDDQIYGTRVASDRLVADLNGMPDGQVFVLFSNDEPSYGHQNTSLFDAVERVGGSYELFSQEMGFATAFMIIGRVGSPARYEKYAGYGGDPTGEGWSGDPNAAIKMSFFVEDNEIHLVQ